MTRATDCLVAGHRGFKAKYTENTLLGFEKCFETGATLFETDVWTSRDGVLVISHDVNTKRVFCDEDGNETNYNILETDYEVLKKLKTIGSGDPMLLFKDLLTWFIDYVKQNSDGSEHRIMLDIKRLNPPKLLQLLIQDMLEVHNDLSWWFPRVQLGVWDLRFIKYLNQDPFFQEQFLSSLPVDGYAHFDVLHISLSWQDSLKYLAYNEYLDALPNDRFKIKLTGISLIYISSWNSGFLTKFLPLLKKQDLKLFTWTINTFAQLDYFLTIGRNAHLKEFGIISDYPDKMVDYLVEHPPRSKDIESMPLLSEEDIVLPLKFKVSSWVFGCLMKIMSVRTSPVDPVLFGSPVEGSENLAIPVPTFTMKFFATLQKYGIF